MRTTTYVKRLDHAPDVVSAFLADLRNDPRWRREIVRSELVSGRPGEPGAVYRESVLWEGINAHVSLTVSEAVIGSRLVITVDGPGYVSVYEYQFVPFDGGTELTLFMSIETKGALRLAEPFMWTLIRSWVERDLPELDSAIRPGHRAAPLSPEREEAAEPGAVFEAAGETPRAFLGEVVDHLAEGIVLFSTEGRIFYANRAVERMLGVPSRAVVGRRFDDPALSLRGLDGRALPAGETPFARVVATGAPVLGMDARVEPPGARPLTLSVNAVPLHVDGELRGVALSTIDVTERRRAESQVRFQSRLLDEVRNAVIATDIAGHVRYVNEEAERLFGRQGGDMSGRDVMRLLQPRAAGREQRVMTEVLAEGRWEGEATLLRRDGSQLPVLLSLGLLRDDRGKAEGFVGVAVDITEMKAAERALNEKDRAIRQAYVDVVDAVTGGKLVLLTASELESALGEPLEDERPLRPDTLAESRRVVRAAMDEACITADPATATVAFSEAATNALKHTGAGTYQVLRKDGSLQFVVVDPGPGIDFRLLPKATLSPGFSSTQTLGMGFSIMLDVADRVLLATAPGQTQVALEFACSSARAQGR